MPRKKKKKKDDIPSPYSDPYAGMDTEQLGRKLELEQREREMRESFGNAQIGRVGSGRNALTSDGTLGSMGMQNPNLNAPVTSSKEWFQNVLGLGLEAFLLIGGLPGLAGRAGVATASRLPGLVRGAGARPLPVRPETSIRRISSAEYINKYPKSVPSRAGEPGLTELQKHVQSVNNAKKAAEAGKSPKGSPQGHAARRRPEEPPKFSNTTDGIPREPSAESVMLDRDLSRRFPFLNKDSIGMVRNFREGIKGKEIDMNKQVFSQTERNFRNRPGSEHHPDVRDRGTANSRKGRPDNRQVAEPSPERGEGWNQFRPTNRAYMEKKAADELAGYDRHYANRNDPTFPGHARLDRAEEAIRKHPASPGQTAVHGDAETIATNKVMRRESNRIPDRPPMVRGPSNVPRRGIPGGEKLGRHITRIGDDATTRRGFEEGGLSSIVGGGLYEGFREKRDRKAKGLNDLRNQGIGIGRYASSAASSLPPYGGRR